MKADLSQQEIDAVFQGTTEPVREQKLDTKPVDFRQLNHIPKSHLRALHFVHDNFAQSLAASLSAYLRSDVILNLVSLEQISYSEFLGTLASPTCVAYVGLKPYEGTAVLELNLGLMFTMLELMLGGKAEKAITPQRELTDVEKSLVQTLLKVILTDLCESWKGVADVSFFLQSVVSEPHLLHVRAAAETLIVIAIEINVEGKSGLMNLAIPSIFIKRVRSNFERLQQLRKGESKEVDQLHIARLLEPAKVLFEAKIDAGTISARDVSNLKVGDVLVIDHPEEEAVLGSLNGRDLWRGQMAVAGEKLAFQLTGSSRRP